MGKCGTARQATDDSIIERMRFACWINKATDEHSEYLILTACPLQQWVHERASMSVYTYVASLFATAVDDLTSYVVFH